MAKKKLEEPNDVLSSLEKKYGVGRINPESLTIVSTGSLRLNQEMKVGGTAVGKIVELFGMESSGKSTIVLHQIAEYQKAFPNKKAALIDFEHCLTGDSLVYVPMLGKNVTCNELENLAEFNVLSKISNKMIPQNAVIKKLGKRDITQIITEKGIELKLTENHKVLTDKGYKEVRDLTVQDYLIKPTSINNDQVGTKRLNNDNDLYFLLGFYMGDGLNLSNYSTPNFAGIDDNLINYIKDIVSRYDCTVKKQGKYNWRISSTLKTNWAINNDELKKLFLSGYTLKELGHHFNLSPETIRRRLIQENIVSNDYDFRKHASSLRNKKRKKLSTKTSLDKIFCPNKITDFLRRFEEIFLSHHEISIPTNLTLDQLKQFISGYIMADGYVIDYNKQKKLHLLISSTSKRMLRDLETSFLKFGITSRLEKIKEKNSNIPGYRLVVSGLTNLSKINNEFNLISYKKERLQVLIEKGKQNKENNLFEELQIKKINRNYSNETVYDISVQNSEFDYQNFLCENVIVHNSFDKDYAEAIGVDVENLLLYQPTTMEDGYDLVLALIEKDLISCAVIDSQSAGIPKAVLAGEMGDATIGLQARLNSKFCLKVKGLLSIHKTTLFIISQLRDNIGGFGGGDTKTTTGGHAFKFYSDVRWKIWKMNDKVNELNKTTIDVVKSKIGKPYGSAKINILWGIGFDKIGEVIEYAEEYDIVKRAGSWYSYGEDKLGQGLDNVRQLMRDNPELFEEIQRKVIDRIYGLDEEIEEKIDETEVQDLREE